MDTTDVVGQVAKFKASIVDKVAADPKLRLLILDDLGSYSQSREFRTGDFSSVRITVTIKSKDIQSTDWRASDEPT